MSGESNDFSVFTHYSTPSANKQVSYIAATVTHHTKTKYFKPPLHSLQFVLLCMTDNNFIIHYYHKLFPILQIKNVPRKIMTALSLILSKEFFRY